MMTENKNNSTEINFSVSSVGRSQWIGISFTQNSTEITNLSQNTFYFFKHPNQILKINTTSTTKLNISNSFYFVDNFDLMMDNTIEFKFNLNKEELKNQEFVLFSSGFGPIPKNFQEIIENNIKIVYRKIRVLYEGNFHFYLH
jgi:hypothetical protein